MFYFKLLACVLLLASALALPLLVVWHSPKASKCDPLIDELSAITQRHAPALDDLMVLEEPMRSERYKQWKESRGKEQIDCYRRHGKTPPAHLVGESRQGAEQ